MDRRVTLFGGILVLAVLGIVGLLSAAVPGSASSAAAPAPTPASSIPLANKGFHREDTLQPGEERYYDVTVNGITTTLNVSLEQSMLQGGVTMKLLGPSGVEYRLLNAGYTTEAFPTRIAVNRVYVGCSIGGGPCSIIINLVGD